MHASHTADVLLKSPVRGLITYLAGHAHTMRSAAFHQVPTPTSTPFLPGIL